MAQVTFWATVLLALVALAKSQSEGQSDVLEGIKQYQDTLPKLEIWNNLEIQPIKVLCKEPEFCFYCPLAISIAKPFYIHHGVQEKATYDHVNEVGVKCLQSLHESKFGHLLTAYDNIALSVLDPQGESGESGDYFGDLQKKAQSKLSLVQSLVCGDKVEKTRHDSSLCVDCTHVDSKACAKHVKKLCAEGTRPKQYRSQKPSYNYKANFLWRKLLGETPAVCKAYKTHYISKEAKQQAYALVATAVASRCEEERHYRKCPYYASHPHGGHKESHYYEPEPAYGYEPQYEAENDYAAPQQYGHHGYHHGPQIETLGYGHEESHPTYEPEGYSPEVNEKPEIEIVDEMKDEPEPPYKPSYGYQEPSYEPSYGHRTSRYEPSYGHEEYKYEEPSYGYDSRGYGFSPHNYGRGSGYGYNQYNRY
ncbi:hypothetical protein BSKO_06646 [Bryopsis sp. KO-2023]|nr:hypothetical protein BSKO_06646 [Bryopsis sp. KO-2023]